MKARFEGHGHQSLFLDFDPVDGIRAGADWERELYRRIVTCQAMVVICSRHSLESKWCFVEMAYARSLGKPVFPVRIDDAAIDSIAGDTQAIDFTRDQDEAYQRLFVGLAAAGLDPASVFPLDPKRPPYPGLLAFEEQDAAVFFGRGDEIASGRELLNRVHHLGDPRFVMVLGASGTGKSSLLRAGLIPHLRRDAERWVIVDPFRPRSDAAGEIATVLSRTFAREGAARSVDAIATALRERGENALAELAIDLLRTAGSQAKVLIAVDQFEEVLGRDEQASGAMRFLTQLRRAVDHPDAPVVVLGTMRSDFLEAFQNSSPLLDLRYGVLSLGPMSETDIEDVIAGPARETEIELDPKLVAALVSESGTPNALPLLAFTLRELWERAADDRKLTYDEYERLGGIRKVIGRAAEDVLASVPMTREQERELRAAFMAMVRITQDEKYARRSVKWADLPAAVHPLLQRFVTARLLASGAEEGERTVEVAHERLFESWERLSRWIAESREALHLRQDIERAARVWREAAGDAREYLWRGARVSRARELMREGVLLLGEDERRFIVASERAESRRRRVFLGTAAVLTLVLAALTAAALWSARQAKRSALQAEERALAADITRTRALSAQNFAEFQRVLARAREPFVDVDEMYALAAIAPKFLQQSKKYDAESRRLEASLGTWRKEQNISAPAQEVLFSVEFLRAGPGMSMLIHYGKPGTPQHIVVDGGSARVYQQSLRPRLDELRAAGDGGPLPVRLVISSQTDFDHIKGLLDLFKAAHEQRQRPPFKIGAVWTNLIAPEEQELTARLARREQKLRLLTTAHALGVPVNAPFTRYVAAPEAGAARVAWADDGFSITILNPQVTWLQEYADWWVSNRRDEAPGVMPALAQIDVIEDFASEQIELLPSPLEIVDPANPGGRERSVVNLASIVLMIEVEGKRILLPADSRSDVLLSGLARAGYTDERGAMDVDVLALPHGGSDRNVSVDFFRRVKAGYYVASCNGRYKNPEVKTFEMLFEGRRGDPRPFVIGLTYAPEEMVDAYPSRELCALFARERARGTPFTLVTPRKGKHGFGIDLWQPAPFVDKGSLNAVCGW